MLLKLGFGNSLSLLLVYLVSMISGKEEFEAKIEGLKSALKWASTEEEESMVINKIVTVLEHAIVLNEPVKKNWVGMEQRELDESNQEKSSKKRSKIDDECDQFLKNVLPPLLNKFFKLISCRFGIFYESSTTSKSTKLNINESVNI